MLSELWRASEYSYSRTEAAAAAYFRCSSGSLFSYSSLLGHLHRGIYVYTRRGGGKHVMWAKKEEGS
jgi:hypothetical protein